MAFRWGRDPKATQLSHVELFSNCSRRELEAIGRLADEVEVPAEYAMTREGRLGREFFVISTGHASVVIDGTTVATLGPGDFFGEIALIDHGPRTATVVSETPMTVYVLDVRAFSGLFDVASVRRRVLAAVSDRLRDSERRMLMPRGALAG